MVGACVALMATVTVLGAVIPRHGAVQTFVHAVGGAILVLRGL